MTPTDSSNINWLLVAVLLIAIAIALYIWQTPIVAWRVSRVLRARAVAKRAAQAAYRFAHAEAMGDADCRVEDERREVVVAESSQGQWVPGPEFLKHVGIAWTKNATEADK